MKFIYNYRVPYADCTIGNHVYYARYLDVLEKARGEFFRDLGATFVHWQIEGAVFPVVEVRLQYKAPARYDDVLKCVLWLSRADGVRLNFAYRIANQLGTVILTGETLHVCTGLDEKPRRLPDALSRQIAPYCHAESEPAD